MWQQIAVRPAGMRQSAWQSTWQSRAGTQGGSYVTLRTRGGGAQEALRALRRGPGTGRGGRRQEGPGRRSGLGRWAPVTVPRTTSSEAWRGQDSVLVGCPAKGSRRAEGVCVQLFGGEGEWEKGGARMRGGRFGVGLS